VQTFRYGRLAGMRTDEALRQILSENETAYSPEMIESLGTEKSRIARELISEANPVVSECVRHRPC
jgi:hypothetical protein